MDIRRFLHQLRPAGTPGAAAGAAVPVDRRSALEAELGPVFTALAGTEGECQRIRTDAAAHCVRLTAEAAAVAARIMAGAEAEAPIRRAEAMDRRVADGRRDSYRVVVAARRRAERIVRGAGPAVEALVGEVVDEVRRHGDGP
ncbi:MAG TPA: hypothetical protein VFH45_02880 [Acidimicrobiales bacterium]|nr:hypothetical protein [Acidimicrobiales bacterium]